MKSLKYRQGTVGQAKDRQRQAIDKGLLDIDITGVLELAYM